jgi:hypothetical protein
MNSYCTVHSVEMSEMTSKTKFDDMGNPKTFFAHRLETGGLCFGESIRKAKTNGRAYQPQAATNNGSYEESQKARQDSIIRQHSQEMALRYLELEQGKLGDSSEIGLERVKNLTDHFAKDIEQIS